MASPTQEWQQHEQDMICEFFKVKVPAVVASNTPCTAASCIEFGQKAIAAKDLKPVLNQGYNSFTLISLQKSQIVQFRLVSFDTEIMRLAGQIYGNTVPIVTFHGDFPLPVYSSKVIPGTPHVLQPFPGKDFPIERQKRTVIGLGEFIAKATFHEQPKESYKVDGWTLKATETLDQLKSNLSLLKTAPEIFEIVSQLTKKVDLLYRLPPVLSHNDFSEVNILVMDNGEVTGVLDFDGASVEAFGMTVYGLYECFFGSMNEGKWSFYNEAAAGYPGKTVRQVLETAFWDSLWSNVSEGLKPRREELKEAVKVALSIGIINRYFIKGMVHKVDMTNNVHKMSLEYAKGILPAIWDGL